MGKHRQWIWRVSPSDDSPLCKHSGVFVDNRLVIAFTERFAAYSALQEFPSAVAGRIDRLIGTGWGKMAVLSRGQWICGQYKWGANG